MSPVVKDDLCLPCSCAQFTASMDAGWTKGWGRREEEEEEEEEEEDLFVFNDTIEGPRAPAVKPGRVTQA